MSEIACKIADLCLEVVRPIDGAFRVASMAAMQRLLPLTTGSFRAVQFQKVGYRSFMAAGIVVKAAPQFSKPAIRALAYKKKDTTET